jgi:hypothetical protein
MQHGDLSSAAWRKSSYSGEGASCVEVAWRKSSFSGEGESCVEVTPAGERVATRDSKHPTGPTLSFTVSEWRRFLAGLD